MRSAIAALTLAVALLTGTVPVAGAYTEEELREAESFAVGNIVWVLYHEIGHLLVDAFRLPILGREEDAVDNLATVILLEERSPVKDAFLIAAVDAFFLMGESAGRSRTLAYHGHGFNEQRAFQLACLMLGSDPATFAGFADTAGLPEQRRQSCAYEYQKARESWFNVLNPYRANWWSGAPRRVSVEYEPAGGTLVQVPAILREAGVLEVAAEYLDRNFALPRPYRLVARSCGESNAFYEPASGSVIICYELFDHFDRLLLEHFRPD